MNQSQADKSIPIFYDQYYSTPKQVSRALKSSQNMRSIMHSNNRSKGR